MVGKSKTQVVKHAFEVIKNDFIQLVDEKTFLIEASFAMQAFAKNKYLNSSTDASKLVAVMNVAQTGLSLNPVTKYAYLVPRRNGSNVECHLEPSYQGLVKLVTDTGSAKNVYCYPVYEGDEFEEILGTTIELVHKPKRTSTDLLLVYAVAILHDGSKQVEVMTVEQINAIRDKSESYKSFKKGNSKSCIWEDYYIEMARKTVIKRIVKYLTKTDQYGKLATAIELDNQDYQASEWQLNMLLQLLPTANLTGKESDLIYSQVETMTSSDCQEYINRFRENKMSPIQAGEPYDMGDLHKDMNEKGLYNAKKDK